MATIITRAGKGSPLENDEVDANFTNLNNDKVETSALNELVDDRVSTLIVPGLGITTDYDDTAGTLTIDSDTIEELCKNGTGSTILKGTPVYQTGTAGNAMVIAPADASSAATMPAVGVLSQDLAAAAEGSLILMGRISGVDTSAFSEGDVIYVASGGGYTNVRPTGQSILVQNLGRVTKVHASNGGGVIMGAGRSNDVPNLTDGNIFIGNASGTYDKRAIVTADISDLTATATELNYTDGVTSSIQTQLDTKAPLASPTFTGTATMDGLTVEAAAPVIEIAAANNQNGRLEFSEAGSTIYSIEMNGTSGSNQDFTIYNDLASASTARFQINQSGDISFYEDTGTTPKFFWDASAEALALGTSTSVSNNRLVINQASGDGQNSGFYMQRNGGAGTSFKIDIDSDDVVNFRRSVSTAIAINSSGNVGIGTLTPNADLELGGTGEVLRLSGSSTNAYIRNTDGTTNQWYIGSGGNAGLQHYIYAAQPMTFHTSGAERMRIDASGTLIHKAAAVFNEDGGDSDFRVESDTNTNALFVDASTSRVGIGESSPDSGLHFSNPDNAYLFIEDTGGTAGGAMNTGVHFYAGGTFGGSVGYSTGSGYMSLSNGRGPIALITNNSSGSASIVNAILYNTSNVWNENGENIDFRVESDTNTHMLFVDASTNRVGINASDVYAHFQVNPITSVVGNQSIAISGSKTYYVNSQWGLIQNQMMVFDNNTSAATGIGGGISLGGNCGGTQDTWLATIESWKQNSTSGNYDGGLKIKTRLNNDPEMRERIHFKTDEAAFNDVSLNYDFRVESDSNTHMLFVDAGNNFAAINTTSNAGTTLNINGNVARGSYTRLSNFNNNNDVIAFNYNVAVNSGNITPIYSGITNAGGSFIHMGTGGQGELEFRAAKHGTDASAFSYLDAGRYLSLLPATKNTGTLTVNASGSDIDFQVESDTNTHALFVDAGNSKVGINNSAPSDELHIIGNAKFNARVSSYLNNATAINKVVKIYERHYLNTNAFAFNNHFVRVEASGATSGAIGYLEFYISHKQQQTSDFWNIIPVKSRSMSLYYKWDTAGGDYSGGLLEIWVQPDNGYQSISVFPDSIVGLYDNIQTGKFMATDEADTNQPTGSTEVIFPLDQDILEYRQSGLFASQYVINGGGNDVDFRVESDTNAHALFVDASANCVGFNKSSPTRTVDIEGASEPLAVKLTAGSNPTIRSEHYSSTDANWYHIRFFTGTGAGGAILVNGLSRTVTYSTTSDYRLKENVVDMTGAIDRVKELNPVRFTWKQVPSGRLVDGFIAHEVSEIVPEAVAGEKDAIDENGNIDPQGIDQAKLVPLLTAALQEAIKRIETLEAEVSALKP
jgi:hypothetical protein